VAAAEKKRLENEVTEEKRKAMEAPAQFNIVSTGRFMLMISLKGCLLVVC
jgi:hypothetical protein